MPRLYREAPLNSVWEGSGNVMCLDVERALARSPDSVHSLTHELREARGGDTRLDRYVSKLETDLAAKIPEGNGRRLVERMVLALQGALLVQHAPQGVADAFCASRLSGDPRGAFGTLPPGLDLRAIVDRAMPNAAA